MSLLTWHKYGCYIANMSHTTIMLNSHIDPTYLPMSTKIQPTTAATSYINAKYVPEANMPLKCHICQLLHEQILNNCVSISTSYVFTSINCYTHIWHYWHITLNKYTCHTTHLCPTALILYSRSRPHITAHTSQNKQETATFINHAIIIYVPTTKMPLKCHINARCATYFMCTYETTMSVYKVHINSMQSIMWPEALVYIYFTLHIYTSNKHAYHIAQIDACPMECYCSLHIDPILLHTSIKNQ